MPFQKIYRLQPNTASVFACSTAASIDSIPPFCFCCSDLGTPGDSYHSSLTVAQILMRMVNAGHNSQLTGLTDFLPDFTFDVLSF